MSEAVSQYSSRNIHQTFSYGIIYIYSIPLESHQGRLKVGFTTISFPNPTQDEINQAANDRIIQQTKTADIRFVLEHAELAVTNEGDYFSDHQVHDVLIRSGFPRKSENIKNTKSEWFEIELDIAKKAIQAVKEGRTALTTAERVSEIPELFTFRPNQCEAIEKTTKAIKSKKKKFLWNAKMRFGKTATAMQVAKENNMQKVLIVTHRPSVSVDWYDDFNKIFAGTEYQYSSKDIGEEISDLVKGAKPFVYFASLQDLRLSKRVVEDENSRSQARGFEKNDEIFDTTWDMLIVDEAHEGTQSNLGDSTFKKIPTNFTLQLSGTPFNILYKHEEDEIYTWDYVMEQQAKLNWDTENPGVPNPYIELPALSIFTYDVDTLQSHIGDFGENFHDVVDGAFKLNEFFRVKKDEEGKDVAEFVYESMVKKFIDLLADDSINTKFPYATQEYRDYNKHALWLLPNRVKVIEAMERLLNDHPIFGTFGIVNISGDSKDDEDTDAKKRVTKAIKDYDYTITLSGQRLTTGASIKEWTAVFMLSDTTSATTYLQTAFRCQTPAKIDGKLKTQGYVFDFAPDRTLKLVAEAIELNHKSGKINTPEQKQAMADFLNFCPILASKGGSMKPYDVGGMLEQLKKAIIDRVSRNGFDDPKLYNDELLKLDEVDLKKFNDLREIVGRSNVERVNEIEINKHGMTDLEREAAEELEKKPKKELTEEQKEALKKLQEARKQKRTAIDILRAVSIRMPMLVYGANVSVRENITLDMFIDLVDEESWEEFMPPGLTKEKFREFTKYYDQDVFKGVAKNIRAKAYECDNLLPTERIEAIAEIFSTFKNPDKETVLTPWNVVNMHMTLAFGGHNFTSGVRDKEDKPVWVSSTHGENIWEKPDVKVLEINSKSGMYPLLAAYNVYTRKLKKSKQPEEKVAQKLWKEVLEENIYVLCKSPMAKSITERTLRGYNQGTNTNIVYIDHLVDKLKQTDTYKGYDVRAELLQKFQITEKDMKFTAVVGNPPYQEKTENSRDNPIYPYFIDESFKLSNKVALIHPARFLFNAGQTSNEWNKKMLSNKHLKVLFFEQKSSEIFPNTDIKGGVTITYFDKEKELGPVGTFSAYEELNIILKKVLQDDFLPISDIVFGNSSYKFSDQLYKENPTLKGRVSATEEKSIGTNIFEVLPEVFFDSVADKKEFIRLYGRKKDKRVFKWVKKKYIALHPNLKKWKVFLPKSNGSGAIGEVLSTPLVGEPLVGGTQTFISFGAYDNQLEAENCMKYIKTKFCRTLLGTLKITQHNPKKTWKNVPLQDFTENSDIDWSLSIPEIDQQLYKKYGLDQKEIDFIESHVKPMT